MIKITTQDLKKLAPQANSSILEGIVGPLNEYMPKYGINNPLRICHFLAQCAEESAGFKTLHEYGRGRGMKYGTTYYGRGIIQLTWKENYKKYGDKLGIDLVSDPDKAADPEVAVQTACLYWQDHNLNTLADNDDIKRITKRINGGYNGLAERTRLLKVAKTIWVEENIKEEEVTIKDKPLNVDEILKIQTKLRDLGYYEVGTADGKLGDRTGSAVLAFRKNEGLPLVTTIDAEFLAKLNVAKPRPISPERKDATQEEAAVKNEIVAPTLSSKVAAGWATFITAIGAIFGAIGDYFKDAWEWLTPFRTSLSHVPLWVWGISAFAVLFYLYDKNRVASNKTLEGYQKGSVL